MRPLSLVRPGERLSVLAIGAHSDDIEIGAGATILGWIAAGVKLDLTWCVLSAVEARAAEATASASDFAAGAASLKIELGAFRDSYFPAQREAIKEWVGDVRAVAPAPDVVLTHRAGDAHQDHRLLNELTWNAFRDHVILEYEIPKWDGDLGQPNLFVPATEAAMRRKCELLMKHFGTQRSKDWFDNDTFLGLARLRGMECRAPERFAEGFYVRKLVL
ncbi:PIG-L domain-containing protein [Alsobacter soli]|uniref:PIG-L domain-containing protein n=1 Tax=Alsobacter soli TaxID=2109933 RepID=A0A2T1HQQ1_9HYPH|nr:PIG-L deacetylase family protein [Alsobacter soli]PSC03985.1 PIG-L domain-containing protein [Alsobacter soli]